MPESPVPVVLNAPYPPRALSPNASSPGAWRKKAKAKRLYRLACCEAAVEQKTALRLKSDERGRVVFPLTPPVVARVTFVVTVDRKRDEDNLAASLKSLWDGLVDARVLVGDSADLLHIERPSIEKGPVALVRVSLRGAA